MITPASILADASAAPTGMRGYSPSDWVIFFGAVTGFVTITLIPFLYKLLDIYKQFLITVKETSEKAGAASAKADATAQTTQQNTVAINDINRQMPSDAATKIIAEAAVVRLKTSEDHSAAIAELERKVAQQGKEGGT